MIILGLFKWGKKVEKAAKPHVEGATAPPTNKATNGSSALQRESLGEPELIRERESLGEPELIRERESLGEPELIREHRHLRLGLSDIDALWIYRKMVEARLLDQKMWNLNRSGRAAFAISSQGHEATHLGIAAAIKPGLDWILPYYRDLGLVLGLGTSVHEILLAHLAKGTDRMSGGRQMPNHWSVPELRIITGSSPISTQLPHAAGIALAIQKNSQDEVVFVTFGDGGASKGDFHEALNFASIHQLPVVFICENNGYAISVPLSKESAVSDIALRGPGYNMVSVTVDGNDPLSVYEAVHEARLRAASGNGPTLIEAKTYRFLAHTSDDDDRTYRSTDEVTKARANDPLTMFLEYLKSVDLLDDEGNQVLYGEIKASIDIESDWAQGDPEPDPRSIGTAVFAKPISFSEPAKYEPQTPNPEEVSEVNYLEAIRSTLDQLLDEFPQAVILGEDVGISGGVFKVTQGLHDKYGDDRVIDTPLAESGLVGFGIGLSLGGKLPIVEIQFADFIHSAFDQIVSEAARIHYRSAGAYSCPLVIRIPYGAGVHGGLYHSQSIEALYAHIPGLKVVAPSTPIDAAGLLRSALLDPDPVLFLEHKKAYRLIKGVLPATIPEIPIGRAEIVRPGSDLSIITYGLMRHYAVEAAEAVSDRASVEVVDIRTITPLDVATIVDSAKRCSKILVVHEDNVAFGVGAEIAATIMENAFFYLDAPVMRLGAPMIPIAPFSSELEKELLITPDKILKAVNELLAF